MSCGAEKTPPAGMREARTTGESPIPWRQAAVTVPAASTASVGSMRSWPLASSTGAPNTPPGGLTAARSRVGVLGSARGLGVAARLTAEAMRIATERHFGGIELEARVELPKTVAMWRHFGFVEAGRNGNRLTMLKLLPVRRG